MSCKKKMLTVEVVSGSMVVVQTQLSKQDFQVHNEVRVTFEIIKTL